MSGGVDSSVAAYILKEQGYEVIGIFMKNWEEKDEDGICTSTNDYEDVAKVAGDLNIPYYAVNFQKEYWDRVFEYFLDEYKKGRTPNPDIMCNQEIKFNAFLDHAMKLDADYIAMGHYAQIENIDGKYFLKRGKDENKDQTYFLSRISGNALEKTLFPIGHLDKSEVREIAEKNNISTWSKKDSTGICFIGERKFDEFLDSFLFTKPGDMVDLDGNILGKHSGLMHYTLGQRRGIGIGGVGNGEAFFVAGKDLEKNILYIAQGEENEALYFKSLIGETPSFITEEPDFPLKCTAKFRYRQKDIGVTVNKIGNELEVIFDKPVKAVTPGQSAVFYMDDICLGNAIIKEINPVNEKYRYLNKF